MQTVLSVQRLTKKTKSKEIVSDISFEVKEGEIVGLLGPNGAGKTTTMKMIVGLSRISSGDVRVMGRSIRSHRAQALPYLGAVIEAPAFYPYLSGYENLRQYQRLHKNANPDFLSEAADRVGIGHALKQRVGTYSLGMKQRLGIAQALLGKPKLLVLDEPMNGLDPVGVRETRNYLHKIASEMGAAVIISSHQLSEIEQMASRVIVMQQGRLITEQNIGDRASGLPQITFHVNDRESTLKTLTSFSPEQCRIAEDNSTRSLPGGLYAITLTLEEAQVPVLIRKLCDAGVDIHRVLPVQTSLEEKFLEWTTERGEVS